MNQVLYFISHLSIQDICGIIGAISSIAALVLQRKGVNSDAYVIVHPQNTNSRPDDLGCAIRTLFYVTFIVSIILLIPLFSGIPVNIFSSISASATSSPTVPLPTEQARAVIQRFYDDINKKDYQAAYSLTTDGLGRSYNAFVGGFVHTEHDDISFDKIKQLPDGSIQVTITVKATEMCTKERINYHHYLYTVGLDHGGYALLKGEEVKPPTYPTCPPT